MPNVTGAVDWMKIAQQAMECGKMAEASAAVQAASMMQSGVSIEQMEAWASAATSSLQQQQQPHIIGKATGKAARKPVEMCGDLKRGRCTRGDNCRYSHAVEDDAWEEEAP